MNVTKHVTLELCRSNSIGSQFSEPTIVYWSMETREEAERIIAESKVANGHFFRIAEDQPGADEWDAIAKEFE